MDASFRRWITVWMPGPFGSRIPTPVPLVKNHTWTKTTATAEINSFISAMKSEGNNYSARLFQAWLSGSGTFTPNGNDINEVETKTGKLTMKLIDHYLSDVGYISSGGKCKKSIPVNMKSKKLGGNYARAHFDYPPIYLHKTAYSRDPVNLDMFIALGGAAYDITGTAKLISTGTDYPDCVCRYTAQLNVKWADRFTANTGTTGVTGFRLWNKTYNAAYFLEAVNGSAAPFNHSISFPTNVIVKKRIRSFGL